MPNTSLENKEKYDPDMAKASVKRDARNYLADRKKHMPFIDNCNGHSHEGEYHYHATIDYPFFMGCYKADPPATNFEQKQRKINSGKRK